MISGQIITAIQEEGQFCNIDLYGKVIYGMEEEKKGESKQYIIAVKFTCTPQSA